MASSSGSKDGSRTAAACPEADITRRDFVGGTLLGAGAALLGMASPGAIRSAAALPAAQSERGHVKEKDERQNRDRWMEKRGQARGPARHGSSRAASDADG